MKILVINSGSSSIKFQLLDMARETPLASGLVERIGEELGSLKFTANGRETLREQAIPDHEAGLGLAIDLLADPEHGVIRHRGEVAGVGHRVVHGGEHFHEPVVIDQDVIRAIEANIPLAPLHNPANLDGIRVAIKIFPKAPQTVVFDTAFHQTMPPHAYMYALPYELYRDLKVRRYGFHGTSHRYVAGECARLLGKPLAQCNLITVHLGNGCSMCAIENGQSVDTSMGMTPLEGLVMGARSGDVDPAIHDFLHNNKGLDVGEIDALLNSASGLKGLCGMNDMRDIHAAIEQGDPLARLALDVQTYRNKKYIGAYMAVLGRVDAIVFTAGIGENDAVVRAMSVAGLDHLGVKLDPKANNGRAREPMKISAPDSPVAVWAIPTNEELAIARATRDILNRR